MILYFIAILPLNNVRSQAFIAVNVLKGLREEQFFELQKELNC